VVNPFFDVVRDLRLLITSHQISQSMILPILANVEWPSAAVAIAIIAFLTVVMCVALKRYSMDAVLKLWAGLGSVAGILAGAFVSYFFTHEATEAKVQAAQAQSAATKTELRLAQTRLNAFKEASDAVKSKLSPQDAKWFDEMIYTPAVRKSRETPTPSSKWQYHIYRNPNSPTPTP